MLYEARTINNKHQNCYSAIPIPEKEFTFPFSKNDHYKKNDPYKMIAVWFNKDIKLVAHYFKEITHDNEGYIINVMKTKGGPLVPNFVDNNGIQTRASIEVNGGKRVRPRKSRQSRKPRNPHNKKTRKHSRK